MSGGDVSGALAGKHILITGGGTGIGLACASRLRADGAIVTIMGRRAPKLEEARASLLADGGPDVRIAAGDVAVEDEVAAAVKIAVDGAGALHGCVAAAGTGTFGPLLDMPQQQWDGVLATNLTGVMLTIKHAGRAMTNGGGSIVAISSIAGVLTHRWMTAYCVSKAGVEMLARNAADELGGVRIRVNAVRPGLVPTDLAAGLVNNPSASADYLDQMPLRRLGTTDDIANIVRFLIGPESAWITGQVIDLAGETGVYATKLLADLGADVIRVEPPDGDPLRAIGPFWHDDGRADRSLYFMSLNTNKRSVTLDITDPKGRATFEKLVATADVVVETYTPGYLDTIGLGYAGLSKIKPDIILTSITGFGQTGPHAKYEWSDIVGVAMSGMMTLAGDKDDPPNRPYGNQGYVCAGIDGALGTMMALVHRDNTGEGQHVDVSMQEALSINQETAMMTWDMNKRIAGRTGARGLIPIDLPGIGVFKANDGEVFAYLGTPGGAPWTAMLAWMQDEGKAEDLGEGDNLEMVQSLNLGFLTGLVREPEKLPARIKVLGHMHEVFSRFCASMTKWDLYQGAQSRRLMIGIVSTPEDLAKNPQLEARKWYQDVEHEHLGEKVRYAGPPYRLSATPWELRRRPPLPGEHTAEVLEEIGVDA